MATSFGRHGPTHPLLGMLVERISRGLLTAYAGRRGFHAPDSAYARERGAAFAERLRRGERVYLVGIGPAGHDSGAALVEASRDDGVRLICNNEEERYSGIRHCAAFPEQGLDALFTTMAGLGIDAGKIHAFAASWDYIALAATLLRSIAEELPGSRIMLDPANFSPMNSHHIGRALKSLARLGRQLGLDGAMPIIGMRHHDNHAYFSYAVSPFAGSAEPAMISVLDGIGDDGAISLYLARGDRIRLIHRNRALFDSLGVFYSMISSTQGGWTILSSEGRYMGAAAWGDGNRLTNPYYRRLREVFHFAGDGTVRLNRALANWSRDLGIRPYTPALEDILGPPIRFEALWNPDAVMRVDMGGVAAGSQERFDKAAATQLVFEDALFHVVGHLIRATGSNRLVLTGGTALNAIANMRLVEHFQGLHVWVPPVPGDAGAAAEGASDDDYNAYSYMVLTVRARPDALRRIPAVIHRDGTSRIQIVRADIDPFTHAYLRAMGRRCGVEVSVNTSLNVAGPIVQTPQQALEALRRSRAMDGVLMIGDEGRAYLAWHTVTAPPKDGGRRLGACLREWEKLSRLPTDFVGALSPTDALRSPAS